MTSVLSNIMLIAVDLLFYNVLFGNRKRMDERILIFVIVLRYVLPFITVLLTLYLSRTREYMADAGCVELMRDNQPLARALMKISQDHQSNQEFYSKEYSQTAHEDVRRASYIFDPVKSGIGTVKSISSMFSTHPNMRSRLEAIGIRKRKPD
jgi:heat shock protein HtpX